MDILQETLFHRLLARYERKFGELPPFTVATLSDAIACMRERLSDSDPHDTDFREKSSEAG